MKGDILQLDGSHSWFPAHDASAEELTTRLAEFDVHLTAALWGEDEVQSSEKCAELEQDIADQFPIYQQGFADNRVKQDRRAMRVRPVDLSYAIVSNDLKISFKLTPGSYATGVLRELFTNIAK